MRVDASSKMEHEQPLCMRNQHNSFQVQKHRLLRRIGRIPAAQSLQKNSKLSQDDLELMVVNLKEMLS
jgi:hypothetical protein